MHVLQSYEKLGYGYESLTKLPEVPGIVARAHTTYKSSGYGYECSTELTKVPGTGNTREKAHPLEVEFDLKWRIEDNLRGWYVLTDWANAPEVICVIQRII